MTLSDLVARMCKNEHWTYVGSGDSFEITIPQPKGRSQSVHAYPFKDGTDEMVRYTSHIGDAATIEDGRARMALEVNGRLPHGCLAIAGGSLVITATRPLSTTTPESSALAVKYLAKQADTYERLIYSADKH